MNTLSWTSPWLLAVLLPLVAVAGAWAQRVWTARSTRARRKLPEHWPLAIRSVVNSEEARV